MEGIISFEGYEVQKIEFKKNPKFKPNEEGIELGFNLGNGYEIEDGGQKLTLGLGASVFEEPEKNNYPFNIHVEIVGTFTSETGNIEEYVANACAILYPYLRNIVSSVTLNANVQPLILPTININSFFEKKEVEFAED